MQSGHADRVLAVAFAPDETILATGSEDRQVRLWDLRSSKEFRTLSGHERAANALAFDAGGERIASGDGSGGIRLWRVASGAMLGSLQGTRAEIEALAFSPHGTKLATGQLRELAIWDVERGEKIGGWPLRSSDVAFSPDGRRIATGTRDGTRVWDLATGESRRVRCDGPPGGPTFRPTALRFSDDGSVLVYEQDQGAVYVCDLRSGKALPFDCHADSRNSVRVRVPPRAPIETISYIRADALSTFAN